MKKPILRTLVQDATAWKAADVKNDSSWTYFLDATELEEIDQALWGVQTQGLTWGEFAKEDFPLPTLAAKLHRIDDQIRNGRGLSCSKGFRSRATRSMRSRRSTGVLARTWDR